MSAEPLLRLLRLRACLTPTTLPCAAEPPSCGAADRAGILKTSQRVLHDASTTQSIWTPKPESHTVAMSAKKQKVSAEERVFLFSSESVNEGHPDKLADQCSDAVLDACLTEDPMSKVRARTGHWGAHAHGRPG